MWSVIPAGHDYIFSFGGLTIHLPAREELQHHITQALQRGERQHDYPITGHRAHEAFGINGLRAFLIKPDQVTFCSLKSFHTFSEGLERKLRDAATHMLDVDSLDGIRHSRLR